MAKKSSVPSEEEMEAMLEGEASPKKKKAPAKTKKTTAKKTTTPKPKAPCKYGPRDAEGKCPKRPKDEGRIIGSTVAKAVTADVKEREKERKTPTLTATEKKALVEVSKELITLAAGTKTGQKAIEKTTAAAQTAGKILKTDIKEIAKGATQSVAGAAKATGAIALGAAVAWVGVQAGLWIRENIDNATKKWKPEYITKQAHIAYATTKSDLEKKLGRPLTEGEDMMVYETFMKPIEKEIMSYLKSLK